VKVLYERDKNRLTVDGIVFTVTNHVRNEIDPVYVRKLHNPAEVRYTVNKDRSKGKPYMPRKFPLGFWKITGVEWYKEIKGIPSFSKSEYGLVRIRTDATQKVNVWTLDKLGGYDKRTDETVDDYGYLFHYSNSSTTLGCGRIETQEAANKLASIIETGLKDGPAILEVV
jgi:hypothetical protein